MDNKNIESIVFTMFNSIISSCISNESHKDDFAIYKDIKYNAMFMLNKIALVMSFCIANRNSAMKENDQEFLRNMAKDFLEECSKHIKDVTLVSFDINNLDKELQNEATKIIESKDTDENILKQMRKFIEKNNLMEKNLIKNGVEIV